MKHPIVANASARLESFRTCANRSYVFALLIQAATIAVAGWGAFLLRFEFDVPAEHQVQFQMALPIWLFTKLGVFHLCGLHRHSWKYFSARDAMRLARTHAVASLIATAVILTFGAQSFPRSIPILDFVLCSLASAGMFLAGRTLLEKNRGARPGEGRQVLIYGAGRAGVMLLNELRMNRGYNVRGFIDDDAAIAGLHVQGVKVFGRGADLESAASRTGAIEILIAIPSATAEEMLEILKHCQKAGIRFRTVAALCEVVEGKGLASQIREVDVQDLLSRYAVSIDHHLLRIKIEDKVVMITGAAGSIGSELCRQVARFRPAAIIAFEIAETPLFHLEREMKDKFPNVPFYPEIGSVQNPRRLAAVLSHYGPAIVYHAAAYKHVPIMESSLFEAIENNVFGTDNVARAAQRYGVSEFVLISSDKAVRPTSVMGATKRLCELLILSLAGSGTRYMAVRFGNVLGSNGSVIPLFKQQIAAGGPVMVTHPEMQRYFMTIPEATQLVLQASAMGRGGEVFVLDMGPQLKIVDLAKKLILLSGLRPDIDIKIEYTGMRPGEKLFEELNLDNEETVATGHEKIKIFADSRSQAVNILPQLTRLRALCETKATPEVIMLVKSIIPEYNPSSHILQQTLAERDSQAPRVLVPKRAIHVAAGGD